jgi:hypothetical protein
MAPSQRHLGYGFSDHRISRSKRSPDPRGTPLGSSQIGVDLSDVIPRSSQIGVGFTHWVPIGVGFSGLPFRALASFAVKFPGFP